jgi:hypothetical protein
MGSGDGDLAATIVGALQQASQRELQQIAFITSNVMGQLPQ